MKRSVSAILVAVIVVLAGFAPSAAAQDYVIQDESKIWVDGTSTKSDWTVQATTIDGTAALDNGAAPTALKLTIPSADIKSNESTIMDRLMHEALKVSEHPTITFTLDEAEASSQGTLKTKGRLTLAGVTNEIEMDVKTEKAADGGVRFTGTAPLKMTDYKMTPPTAMFGALRTGDDVTIGFDVVFVPNN